MAHEPLLIEITEANLTALATKVAEIEAIFPFLDNFTILEIKKIICMGDIRIAQAQKLLDIALQHPKIIPPDFSVSDFESEMKAFIQTRGLMRIPVFSLLEKIDKAGKIIGNGAFTKALKVKELLEVANRDNPGYDQLMREVNEMFARPKKKSKAVKKD